MKRDIFYDIVKGIAIVLVVFGHCIQYGSGEHYENARLFMDEWLYKLIYSFHMPLFALISGYFFILHVKNIQQVIFLNQNV